ncbi:MAG: hypothetical protein Q9O74_07750 [Planctomycetota bacterium]|nr:hypothetical protein [Planctomycetota bacterium]
MILRDRDANTAWESQADGTLEERVYYCHPPHTGTRSSFRHHSGLGKESPGLGLRFSDGVVWNL